MSFLNRPASLVICFLPVLALTIAMPRAAAFLPGLLGLILCGLTLASAQRPVLKKDYPFWIVAAIIPALVALTSLWAHDPDFVLERSVKLVGIIFPAALLIAVLSVRQWTAPSLKQFYLCFYIMFCFAAVIIMIENLSDQSLSRFVRATVFDAQATRNVQYNRSLVVMSLLYLPVVAGLQNLYADHKKARLFHIGLATVCMIATLSATKSQTAQMSFLVAAAFYFLYPYTLNIRARLIHVLTFVCVLAMLISPFVVTKLQSYVPEDRNDVPSLILEASIPHRLEVWNFAATEALKSPWIGNGVEALRDMKSDTWMRFPDNDHILHPHNAPMQIWVEFGLLGALATCLFFIWLARRIDSLEGQRRRLALSLSVSSLLVLSVGYGLWQSWQIGLLFFLPSLVILATDKTLLAKSKG